MTKRKVDILTGIVCFVVAAVFWFQGRELEAHHNLFPLLLEGFLVLSGIYLIIAGVLNKTGNKADNVNIDYGRALQMILATIVYIVAVNMIGFYVSSMLFLTLMSWYLNERGLTLPALGISLAFATILTGAIYAVFTMFLRVPTPSGILF
ncbi:tripartite tricarboxylate transporter TctB family protein [Desulforamulus aquiferis]|uniref:Tripartite tricarboxylate transporter TctB family protein n=1 Tax=Desulforamulus aquiferis TaxID=1397668 RepID=A0AAW7ZF08_9FIRM|nr:tripartite tricarboxylate transporter TctB family protein [Desulforamulus aquiferis]MDO7788312.1 tripartite tricarboxylate transporter TctB family protein [Desulforamulus aquiferis]RYD04147.1 hypothetical protein N752_16345 [Desulforamulus aquiferis]